MTTHSVSRTATCKRCGSATVTWNQNNHGKWYLTEVFSWSLDDKDSNERTDHRDFHSKYCGKPVLHAGRQAVIVSQLMKDQQERDAHAEKREAERLATEVEKLEAWYAMTPEQQGALIEKLRNEIKRTVDGITMDYMTEYMQAISQAEALRNEIDLYLSDDFDTEEV